MNKTGIEWCDATWNPVTGCQHDCPYCYAERQAKRFGGYDLNGVRKHEPVHPSVMELRDPLHIVRKNGRQQVAPFPYDFAPTLHRYRLEEPAKVKTPKRVFVGSMCDLFGKWVPDEWIQAVFAACERAPQHQYLFLTKNPGRYLELYRAKAFPYKENYWFGTTCTTPDAEFTWMKDVPYHSFVSVEPIMAGGWDAPGPEKWPEWVIVGAETGSRKDKVVPEKEWVMDLARHCKASGVPVFFKDSLIPLFSDKPGARIHADCRQFPEGLRMEGGS